MQTSYWLILFVVLLTVEIFTMGLTTIWFAAGALAAFLVGMLGLGLPVQAATFIVVSVILFVVTRPIAVRFFNQEREKTNVEGLIGQQGLVKQDIDTLQATGQVEVRGQEWSARTEAPDGKILKGTTVVVDGIQGVRLIVREKEEKKDA